MSKFRSAAVACAVAGAVALGGCASITAKSGAGFFVTSTGGGKGADFGGLAGADKHCAALAAAAGLPDRAWHAYLSTQASGSTPAINAKDRIGGGPWTNVKGVIIARDVADLHATEQHHETDCVVGERRNRQRSRRYAKQTRYPDGLAAGRHGVCRRRRQDVWQLDEERQ